MENGKNFYDYFLSRKRNTNEHIIQKEGCVFGALLVLESSLENESEITTYLGRGRLLLLSDNSKKFLGISTSSLAKNKIETTLRFFRRDEGETGIVIERDTKSITYQFSWQKPSEVCITVNDGDQTASGVINEAEVNSKLKNDIGILVEILDKKKT